MALSRRKSKPQPKSTRTGTTRRKRSTSPGAILARIDALMLELEAWRKQLESPAATASTPKGLTSSLFGAAGQGNAGEYDLDLEWKRFAEWHSS